MRRFLCLLLPLLVCLPAFSDERDKAKSKAAALLQLEKSARTREKILKDPIAAAAFSAESGKRVVIWVGPAAPEVVKALPELHHLQVQEFQGSSKPRVILPTSAGWYWEIERVAPPEQIKSIQKALRPPPESSLAPRLVSFRVC